MAVQHGRLCLRRPAKKIILRKGQHKHSWFELILHQWIHCYDYYNPFLAIDSPKSFTEDLQAKTLNGIKLHIMFNTVNVQLVYWPSTVTSRFHEEMLTNNLELSELTLRHRLRLLSSIACTWYHFLRSSFLWLRYGIPYRQKVAVFDWIYMWLKCGKSLLHLCWMVLLHPSWCGIPHAVFDRYLSCVWLHLESAGLSIEA